MAKLLDMVNLVEHFRVCSGKTIRHGYLAEQLGACSGNAIGHGSLLNN